MFKIPRRNAAFTHLNIRGENHGKKKIAAVDLSVNFTGDGTLLNLLVPAPQDKDNDAEAFFFNEDGNLRVPTMNPIPLNRNPEGLMFTIYDRKEPMVFREGKATGFVIEFQEGGTIKVSCKLQGIPDDGYTERLKKIVFGSIEMSIESEQDDLFALPPPAADDKDGKDKGAEDQGNLLAGALENGAAGKVTDGTGKAKPEKKAKTAKAKAPAKKKAGGKRT